MGTKVKGDANTQYLVVVAKINLDDLAEDPHAEAFDAVDLEFLEDEDGMYIEDENGDPVVAERWFDESNFSAELDEKFQELFGKGLEGGWIHTVHRGDYLLAAAGKSKSKDAIRRFLRDKLGLWS